MHVCQGAVANASAESVSEAAVVLPAASGVCPLEVAAGAGVIVSQVAQAGRWLLCSLAWGACQQAWCVAV